MEEFLSIAEKIYQKTYNEIAEENSNAVSSVVVENHHLNRLGMAKILVHCFFKQKAFHYYVIGSTDYVHECNSMYYKK